VKGIILAGGAGTRLAPLTRMINKHLLPVGRYPMIHYAVAKLKQAGIGDILLITGKQSSGLFMDYLGSGEEWGVRLTYRIQERAGGIAEALGLAETFIEPGGKFVVILGDNLFAADLAPYVEEFGRQPEGSAMVLLKEVKDPRRYGVPAMDGDRIRCIEEKPEHPPSPFCVTGIYLYDTGVFEIIRTLKPSRRGEMEITDVNNVYAERGRLGSRVLHGWWIDAGTHESLYEAFLRMKEQEASAGLGAERDEGKTP